MKKVIRLTEDDLTRIVKRVINEGKKKEDNDLFIAKEGNNELIVSEKMLQPSKISTLLNKLNKSGFRLGSGHEEIKIVKRDDDSYVFIGVTYYGAPTQRVDFERVKSKEDWWDENSKRFLKSIDDLQYEDWEGLVKEPEDFEGVYSSTNKQRGLYLLHTYSIDELEELIDSNTFDEEE